MSYRLVCGHRNPVFATGLPCLVAWSPGRQPPPIGYGRPVGAPALVYRRIISPSRVPKSGGNISCVVLLFYIDKLARKGSCGLDMYVKYYFGFLFLVYVVSIKERGGWKKSS